MVIKIYTLSDPETGMVKYVGRTKCELKIRLRGHLTKNQKNSKKFSWIQSLLKKNKMPIIELVEEIFLKETKEDWDFSYEVEKFWIEQFQVWGFKLLNHIDKGAGNRGKCWNENQYLKMCKPVFQYDLKGNYIAGYDSVVEASQKNKILYKIIQGAAREKERRFGSGYLWSYVKQLNVEPYKRKNSNTVYQYNLSGELVGVYYSNKDLREKNFKYKLVVACSKGELKTYKNFIWTTIKKDKIKIPTRKEQVGKKIYQYDKNKNFIFEWIDAKQIEKEMKISANGVRKVASGHKKTYKNFYWSYKKLNND